MVFLQPHSDSNFFVITPDAATRLRPRLYLVPQCYRTSRLARTLLSISSPDTIYELLLALPWHGGHRLGDCLNGRKYIGCLTEPLRRRRSWWSAPHFTVQSAVVDLALTNCLEKPF